MTSRRPSLLWSVAAATGVCLSLAGCGTTYQIKVDSISKPLPPKEALSFKIRNKASVANGEESLRDQEVDNFVKTALSGKGYYEAPSLESADLVVEVDYGIEKPRSKAAPNSMPIYAQVGGATRYEQIPVVDSRGRSSVRTVTVYEPPKTELLGYQDVMMQVTTYEKFLNIKARDNRVTVEGRPAPEIWSVRVSSEDESNDLRKYLPMLASASIDYIATDSTTQKVVKVKEKDPSVVFIKKGL